MQEFLLRLKLDTGYYTIILDSLLNNVVAMSTRLYLDRFVMYVHTCVKLTLICHEILFHAQIIGDKLKLSRQQNTSKLDEFTLLVIS